MAKQEDYFNLELLILDSQLKKRMRPVTKLNILVSSTSDFEPEGLFSTEIFGAVGTEERNSTFAYINLNTKVLHPLIYHHVTTLKSLYKDIMEGKKYAVFNKKTKDFELSTITEGRTGYTFFMEHIEELKPEERKSVQRDFKLKMFYKYRDKVNLLDSFLVLPAGLRDYSVDAKGNPTESDVNDLYRKLLSVTMTLTNTNMKTNDPSLDGIRIKIQNTVLEIYDYYMDLLNGKNSFIEGKWAKRGVVNGTRNVITPTIPNITDLDSDDNIDFNNTVVGIYQYVRAIAPIAMNKILTIFISNIMHPESSTAMLINKKSLKTEVVEIPVKTRQEWLSTEGLDGIINKLAQEDLRTEPIIIHDHYAFLVYDTGKEIEVYANTASIPEDIDTSKLRPLTYAEMLYISILGVKDKYPALLTRYPVANLGGIYPTKPYVKTTVKSRKVKVKINGAEITANEYPILGSKFVNSISPNNTHIGRLGADYDGAA